MQSESNHQQKRGMSIRKWERTSKKVSDYTGQQTSSIQSKNMFYWISFCFYEQNTVIKKKISVLCTGKKTFMQMKKCQQSCCFSPPFVFSLPAALIWFPYLCFSGTHASCGNTNLKVKAQVTKCKQAFKIKTESRESMQMEERLQYITVV